MSRKLLIIIVTIFAILAMATAYLHFRCPLLTVVLQVKTFEKGTRQVSVEDANGRSHATGFELGDDQGEPSFYVIELPRVVPKQVFIQPLASPGKFAIERVTLKGGGFSYSWDSSGVCSKKTLSNGIIARGACGGNGPSLVLRDDGLHMSVPPGIYPPSTTRGLFAGSASCVLVLLAGFWLFQRVKADTGCGLQLLYVSRIAWLAVIGAFLLQFLALWRYSVDIPFWEEWEYFLPQGLPSGLSWEWLFSFAGYHRVVPTKLMAWVNLQFFGLDFRFQKLYNYLLFGGVIGILVVLKNRIIGRHEFTLFPAFLLFLMSPIAYENHSNSYQSQIHILIILALVALLHLYDKEFKASSSVFFLLAVVVAINTFSAGMTVAAVLLPCWAAHVLLQLKSGSVPKVKGALWLATGSVTILGAAASWIFNYRQPSDCRWVSPFTREFRDTFLNLVSFGFGFEQENIFLGLLCIIVVVLPLILLWCKGTFRRNIGVWQLTTGVALFLAILATIGVTRAIFAGTAKASRYVEFGLMLIPFTSIAWWLVLERPTQRFVVLLLLWLGCVISFSDDWSFSPYRDGGQMDTFVLETLEDYQLGRGDGAFPWTHPKPLPPFFAGASRLHVKFTRQFRDIKQDATIPHIAQPSGVAGE